MLRKAWQNMTDTQAKKKRIYKALFFLAINYLISTWGVNQTINPWIYFKQLSAQKLMIQPVIKEDYIEIINNDMDKYPYLLLDIVECKQFFQVISVQTKDENILSVELCKGINCLDMHLYGNTILIPQDEIVKYGITLNDTLATSEPYVDIHKSIIIFMSFTFFSAFWELVQSIKKRYTK